ncbi:protein kinase [Candidatus Woesearchaeota archaeon]|nr:protein kinase [Candidatus Woesearchaeota archaeon]
MKKELFNELCSLIDKEDDINYQVLTEIVEFNEVSSLEELFECARISSPYKVVRKIDEGKSGVVYTVYSPDLRKYFALKVIRDKFSPKEAELMARLIGEDLENIVQIHDAGYHIVKVDGEEAYAILEEYVDGAKLSDTIKAIAKEDLYNERAFEIGAQILNGIISLRRYGITHRDIYPGNIILEYRSLGDPDFKRTLKILDFGIATDQEHQRQVDGRRYGTPSRTYANDLFSLGLIVFELYVGEHLLGEKEEDELTSQHADRIGRLKEVMFDEQGNLQPRYKAKIPDKIKPIVLPCLYGEDLETIKQGFVGAYSSAEFYFMNKLDLVRRVMELSFEVVNLKEDLAKHSFYKFDLTSRVRELEEEIAALKSHKT